MSICRNICANGWRRGQRPRAISSSKSTSIRRASCSPPRHCERSEAIHIAARRKNGLRRRYAPRNDGESIHEKSLPSFATAGLSARERIRDGYFDATLTRSVEPETWSCALGDDLGGNAADAGAGQTDGAGSTRREVEDTPPDEGTAVVDRHDDRSAAMGDAQLGAERQGPMRRCHGVLVEALAGRGLAAGFIAVKGGHAREAVPRS